MTRNIDISSQNFDIGTVSGINNVVDEARLESHQLVYANNIDISNAGKPSSRDGYIKKFTPSGSVHSMWGDDKMCFFVEDGTLYRLLEDYTASALRANVGNYPMSFCEVNDNYYYTNPGVIGRISQGINFNFAVPTDEFRHAMPPGQHIEYYNGRLYVARNETMWYSDVNYLEQTDRRFNHQKFENEITMMNAVSDGIWLCVGDIHRKATYFMQGGTREDMALRAFANYGCLEGSDVKIEDGQKVGEGLTGQVVMWTSDQGICIGAAGGRFINVTDGKYNVSSRRFAAGLFRDVDGLAQYIVNLWN
jgi:hypothetical protein